MDNTAIWESEAIWLERPGTKECVPWFPLYKIINRQNKFMVLEDETVAPLGRRMGHLGGECTGGTLGRQQWAGVLLGHGELCLGDWCTLLSLR